jgi:hypothetical protein
MATWLRLASDHGGWSLTDSGQMRRIVQGMTDPAGQLPSILFFVGKASKARALRSLFPYNNVGRGAPDGIARLHLSTNASTRCPTLFIDGNLDASVKRSVIADRHRTSPAYHYRIRCEETRSYKDLRNQIYSQLLFPFIHTLCLFADDFDGLAELHQLLRTWASAAVNPEDLSRTRPRIVVVLTDPKNAADASNVIDQDLRTTIIPCFASALTVLDLRRRHELSAPALFEPLRRSVFHELNVARNAAEEQRLLFSAVHLEALLRRAVQHVAQEPNLPFDVIKATRADNEVPPGITQHLEVFLILAERTKLPWSAIATFIASALLVDAYPPGMHSTFPTARATGQAMVVQVLT